LQTRNSKKNSEDPIGGLNLLTHPLGAPVNNVNLTTPVRRSAWNCTLQVATYTRTGNKNFQLSAFYSTPDLH